MPGPPPKPAERKRRTGNPGKRKLIEPVSVLPQATTMPDPVRPLGQAGLDLWRRVWRAGTAWVSPDTDVEMLQIVCEQADERVALRVRVLRGDGDWRDRVALRMLDERVVAGLSLLGLTPADRARYGFAEVKREDELDRFRARQAARRASGDVGS